MVLQPLAQMKHRIALAREQGVDGDAALGGEALEAAAFELVGDEDLALRRGQLGERGLEIVAQKPVGVARLGTVLRRLRLGGEDVAVAVVTGSTLASGSVFLRKRSVIRFAATRNSQAPTCSIGVASRVASISSENTSCRMSSASAMSATRRRMKPRSRRASRPKVPAMTRSCSAKEAVA